MKRAISIVIGVVAVCSVSIAAQWAKFPTPGVPRDAQGKVNMDAPPPRTADGKLDLSGTWMRANSGPPGRGGRGRGAGAAATDAGRGGQNAAGRSGAAPAAETGGGPPAAGAGGGRGGVTLEPATAPFPFDPNGPPVATFFEAGGNMEGGLPYTPWAADIKKARIRGRQGQGQPRRELHADGLPAVPSAAAAAQDHPDAGADPDRVRSQLRPAPHLHWMAASCRRRANRSRGGTATRSATGKATRSSSRPTTCAARKTAPTTAGST